MYNVHLLNRIITNAEEIAFYGGHNIELTNLQVVTIPITITAQLLC